MEIKNYDSIFSTDNKTVYARYDNKWGWGLYATQSFLTGEIVLKLHIQDLIESRLNKVPTPGNCAVRGLIIAPNVVWCPTDKHPFWNLNHSCNANCGINHWGKMFDGYIPIVAYEDIQPHTHLTIDYSTITTINEVDEDGLPWKITNCFCGEANCRGVISEFHVLDEHIKWQIVTEPHHSVRYGGVFAYILNEEKTITKRLEVYSSQIYADFLDVLSQQFDFSRHFTQDNSNQTSPDC